MLKLLAKCILYDIDFSKKRPCHNFEQPSLTDSSNGLYIIDPSEIPFDSYPLFFKNKVESKLLNFANQIYAVSADDNVHSNKMLNNRAWNVEQMYMDMKMLEWYAKDNRARIQTS